MNSFFKVTVTLLLITGIISCDSSKGDATPNEKNPTPLLHTVIFKLNEVSEAEKTFFMEQLQSLSSIEQTKNLIVSEYTKTDDPRAKQDYDIILQMQFANKEEMKAYSMNKYHLKVRKQIGKHVAQAPVVYDSWIE